MKKNSNSTYLIPILAIGIIGGLVVYLLQIESQPNWKIITIIVLTLSLLIIPLQRSYQRAHDRKHNIPPEDEMSRMLEVYSGAYAFRYSMMSWFTIFLLRNYFLDPEEMLGVGILAAGAIYGLTWLYFKRNGIPYEDQN